MARTMVSLVMLAVVWLAAVFALTAVPAPQAAADEAAIHQVVQRVEDGWNALDGAAFAAPFAEDADYVVVNGMHLKGRETIARAHAQIFATIYKESRNKATVKSLRFLRPDVAVVHIEWNLEFKAEGELRSNRAMNTVVMTKANDQWSIAAFHNTTIAPPNR